MISVTEYNKEMFEEVLEYCKSEFDTTEPAASNMWDEAWHDNWSTLPYLLKNTNRFTGLKGKFFILRDDAKIIGCSGVYVSDFSDNVAFLGVRSWLTRRYRKKQLVREYILPRQKQWAIDNNALILCLSFNEYNKNLRKMFIAGQQVYKRTEKHLFYHNFNMLDYQVTIQGVPQWVIYEKLSRWDYNWQPLAT